MEPLPYHERIALYQNHITPFQLRLRAGKQKLYIPQLVGLRRSITNGHFHLTPELFLQRTGVTEFTCPADRFDLGEGEMAVISRGVPHAETARQSPKHPFRGLVFTFEPNSFSLLKSHAGTDGRPWVIFADRFMVPQSGQLARYLDDLGEWGNGNPMVAQGLLLAFCAIILETLKTAAEGKPTTAQDVSPRVQQCREIIKAYLSDPTLSVHRLAKNLRCTPDYLTRCFRLETGESLNAHIRNERLAYSQTLLQNPELNISEIAWATGFHSPNYFIRAFREYSGQTPKSYRRRLARA
ncbi:MAG: helix-turn-helix transcriptional regulator [Verrucomicrobiota bacterium]|nr:helix-turn-helix transcriptional regulator [Verrucomicrobiota bacterium]